MRYIYSVIENIYNRKTKIVKNGMIFGTCKVDLELHEDAHGTYNPSLYYLLTKEKRHINIIVIIIISYIIHAEDSE